MSCGISESAYSPGGDMRGDSNLVSGTATVGKDVPQVQACQ